jgi:hypothetical protein
MKLILSPILVLVVSLAMQTSASGQGDFKVFVADDDVTRELDLKATEGQNGQVNEVTGFAIKPKSVVQIKQNENLTVSTSINETERIEKVKVTDQSGELIELTKIGGNKWSLQGFDDGVYLLDVIVNIPEGGKGAYETVLVILAPNTQDLNPTQVIKQTVNIQVDVKEKMFKDKDNENDKEEEDLRRICTFNPSDKRCSPDKNGNCPEGFATNEDGQCFPTGPCPNGYHRANDDETGRCISEDHLKQCDDGSWADEDDFCPEDAEPEPTPEPTPEPPTEELTANCGGEPCTPTEKEDSTIEAEDDSEPVVDPDPDQE